MSGLRHLAPLAIAAGCQFARPDPVQQDGPSGDAHTDGASSLCFGASFEHVCLAREPTGPFAASSNMVIDTAGSPLCAPLTASTVDACVVAGTTIDIEARLTATGPRPLVLLSLTQLVIGEVGYLDASSSHLGMPIGPGANGMLCLPPQPAMANGGGAGGSFAGRGGNGGAGNTGNGGAAAPASSMTVLRGGCGGGVGGGMLGTSAGAGGGAVDLIAADAILIDGIVNASGAGGAGAQQGGGSGAGSGGMIGLDARHVQITMTAQLFANGGGGGGGAADAAAGADGADPAMATTQALGGVGGGQGGNGGAGSVGTAIEGLVGSSGNPGGGGGGGGAGMIAVEASSLALSGAVSPGLTKM